MLSDAEMEAWEVPTNKVIKQLAEKGPHSEIFPNTILIAEKNLYLKDYVRISEFCWVHAGQKTVIGNFVHLGANMSLNGGGTCIIEDFSGIASGTRLISGSEEIDGSALIGPMVPQEFRNAVRSKIHLQKHVFLCSNTVVFPGVTIGEGAVVAAGMVVTKDIEPWTINIPGKPVKKRPSAKIKELEKACYEKMGVTPFVYNG